VIAPNILVISEEFGDWQDSKRRIDLLGLDRDANLVVIELKRTDDGGHMELQAIRYASMVSTMTFDRAIQVFAEYLGKIGKVDQNARKTLLDFLSWEIPDEAQFAQDVRIVLASAEFSKEITSSVLWLRDHNVDIRCVRFRPYLFQTHVLVDVQQIIPLPEAAEFQIQLRNKDRKEREARATSSDRTRYDIEIDGTRHSSIGKGKAIFFICKYLCEKNIAPDAIASLFTWRSKRTWFDVDGIVDVQEFMTLAAEKSAAKGKNFDLIRWFCGEDQLIYSDGKTYTFSTQWGGESWNNAMLALKEAYPQFNIDFTPTV